MGEDVGVLHESREALAAGPDGHERDVIGGVRVARPAEAGAVAEELAELGHDGVHLVEELRGFTGEHLGK